MNAPARRSSSAAFLPLATSIGVRTQIATYPLSEANAALDDLRAGAFTGSAVLEIGA